MPQLVTVRVKRPNHRTVRLWVPVLLVVIVLSPVLLLALLGGIVVGYVYRIDSLRTLRGVWRVISALPGTRFDVEYDRTAFLVIIRLESDSPMNEQRKAILDMLAEGKITATEAERLIAAIEPGEPTTQSPSARTKGKAKYLRLVIDTMDNGEPGRVNIRVPLALLRAGVRLTALVPPQALEKANAEMAKNGVPFDLTQLKPDELEELVNHLDEVTVEIDQPDAQVRIFSE